MSRVLPSLRLAPAALLLLLTGAGAVVLRFDPKDTAAVPKRLSHAGLFVEGARGATDTALKPFEVNAALWSDGARKQRWIALPPGTHVPYVDSSDALDFPHGTMFVKTFLIDTIDGDASTAVPRETRLLVKDVHVDWGTPKWYGFTYRWNPAATDAVLVEEGGFDTLYAQRGADGRESYVKWTFPARSACDECHRDNVTSDPAAQARGALGFMPVQLKRPDPVKTGSPVNPINQIDRLFDHGVFQGDRPTIAQRARRWKGLSEAPPPGLDPDARFRFVDTVARSYIAANCSGCHGDRGMRHLNYDFFDLTPRLEFGSRVSIMQSILPLVEDGIVQSTPESESYRRALGFAGIDTSTGTLWDLRRPASGEVLLVNPGHVSASSVLYRQWVRHSPPLDSLLALEAEAGRPPAERRPWLFEVPWGSAAWRARLAEHGVDPRLVVRFDPDFRQMPPLASHRPDTAALRVLAEWVKGYRTLQRVPGEDSVTSVRRLAHRKPVAPLLQGRVLSLPLGEAGVVRLTNVNGQGVLLTAGSAGRFEIPASLPAGVYILRAGGGTFRIVLR